MPRSLLVLRNAPFWAFLGAAETTKNTPHCLSRAWSASRSCRRHMSSGLPSNECFAAAACSSRSAASTPSCLQKPCPGKHDGGVPARNEHAGKGTGSNTRKLQSKHFVQKTPVILTRSHENICTSQHTRFLHWRAGTDTLERVSWMPQSTLRQDDGGNRRSDGESNRTSSSRNSDTL